MSARAAWRLISLGFTRVFRYAPGKKDWMANGLPIEGKEAHVRRAGDLARLDVPTCGLAERVGEVKERIQKMGMDSVLVTNSDGKLFGLLKREDVEKAFVAE